MRDQDWNRILAGIKNGTCTPFLGAGAAAGILPTGAALASKLAEKGYPLPDRHDLARVSQYLAITERDPVYVKEEFVAAPIKQNSLKGPGPVHQTLAELPLPLYLTTNYDKLMTVALENVGRAPQTRLVHWAKGLGEPEEKAVEPRKEAPLVYHFHGNVDAPHTMVLTEDDYLDFLVSNVANPDHVNHFVRRALATTTLVFLGYSLTDVTFRMLFRTVRRYIALSGLSERRHLSVQLLPSDVASHDDYSQSQVKAYLNQYFDRIAVDVYWGTCEDFAKELSERWKA